MSAGEPTDTPRPAPSVFLSYASEDRAAAQVIRDALPALGLDVWYDESGLGGGEAWDQKIRKQIRECDFFMPVVSAQTEARHEGYFRREWRLAAERTLDMADDHIFLLPVVIDDTNELTARVPEKFHAVQWTRLPGGKSTPAFEALCRRLASGEVAEVPPSAGVPPVRSRTNQPSNARGLASKPEYPEFPRHEPGQKASYYRQVVAWTLRSARTAFKRLPRVVKYILYAWLIATVVSRGCTSTNNHPKRISAENAKKLKEISDRYLNGSDKADLAGLAAQIAQQFPKEAGDTQEVRSVVLAIPFRVPPDDQHAKRVAASIFSQIFGTLSIAQKGHVSLTNAPLPSSDPSAAAEQGRASHSEYVVYGEVDGQTLTVRLVTVSDGAVIWSKDYPLEGADAAAIAADVEAKVPSEDSD